MARDDYRKYRRSLCERCGLPSRNTRQLDVHHKDRNKANNDPLNLETLCRSCHIKEHAFDELRVISNSNRDAVREANRRRRGQPKTEIHRRRISEAQKGRVQPDHVRRAVAEANRKRSGSFLWIRPDGTRYQSHESHDENDRRVRP